MNKNRIKLLLENKNKEYNIYDIKIDNRLSIKNKKGTMHHIIPIGFELIPNLTIYWTIKWLINNKIKNIGFRLNNNELVINKSGTISLSQIEHSDLHLFLDLQRKALYLLENIFNFENIVFPIDRKYKICYIDRKGYQSKILENEEGSTDIEKSKEKFTSSAQEKKYKIKMTYKGKDRAKKVQEALGKANLLIDSEFINVMNLLNWKYELKYINEATSLIRNTYIKNNNAIKNLIYAKENGFNTEEDIEEVTIKGNSELIGGGNHMKLKKFQPEINSIFHLGLTTSIKKILILIDEDYNIIHGKPLLAYLMQKNMNTIPFNLLKVTKEQIEMLENKLGFYLNK